MGVGQETGRRRAREAFFGVTKRRLKPEGRRADFRGMDPIKQKLWADLREVLSEIARAWHLTRRAVR